MTLFGNMQSAVTFITSCNPSTILGGKNGFMIWMRKFMLEEIKFLAQGHTSREGPCQGSEPGSEACAFNLHIGAMKQCSTSDAIGEMQIRAMKF